MPKLTKPVAILLIITLSLFIVTVAAIVYKLAASNNAVITVIESTVPIPVNLTPATATINEGQQVLLTATIPNANGNGKTIRFMEGDVEIGTDIIVNQIATLLITPSAGVHTYHTAAEP